MTIPSQPPPKDGPGVQATPILWLSTDSGYWCRDFNYENRLPDLVVYSDFSALRVENMSQDCAVDPMVSTGWVAPATVVDLVTLFHSANLGGADLDHPHAYDVSTSYVTLNIDGSAIQVASVVGISVGGAPQDQAEQRKALTAIRSGLLDGFTSTGYWTPDRLIAAPLRGESVSNPLGPVALWPSVEVGPGCTAIPDKDVESVMDSAGYPFPSGWWTVGGIDTELVIGMVLPGFAPCTGLPLS